MKLKLLFIAVAAALLAYCVTGCLAVATGAVAYSVSVNDQEHAAYTEYYFDAVKNNSPIIPEDKWLQDYRFKMKYTEYYHNTIAKNALTNTPTLIPAFDEWKTNEYVKSQAEAAKRLQPHYH